MMIDLPKGVFKDETKCLIRFSTPTFETRAKVMIAIYSIVIVMILPKYLLIRSQLSKTVLSG